MLAGVATVGCAGAAGAAVAEGSSYTSLFLRTHRGFAPPARLGSWKQGHEASEAPEASLRAPAAPAVAVPASGGAFVQTRHARTSAAVAASTGANAAPLPPRAAPTARASAAAAAPSAVSAAPTLAAPLTSTGKRPAGIAASSASETSSTAGAAPTAASAASVARCPAVGAASSDSSAALAASAARRSRAVASSAESAAGVTTSAVAVASSGREAATPTAVRATPESCQARSLRGRRVPPRSTSCGSSSTRNRQVCSNRGASCESARRGSDCGLAAQAASRRPATTPDDGSSGSSASSRMAAALASADGTLQNGIKGRHRSSSCTSSQRPRSNASMSRSSAHDCSWPAHHETLQPASQIPASEEDSARHSLECRPDDVDRRRDNVAVTGMSDASGMLGPRAFAVSNEPLGLGEHGGSERSEIPRSCAHADQVAAFPVSSLPSQVRCFPGPRFPGGPGGPGSPGGPGGPRCPGGSSGGHGHAIPQIGSIEESTLHAGHVSSVIPAAADFDHAAEVGAFHGGANAHDLVVETATSVSFSPSAQMTSPVGDGLEAAQAEFDLQIARAAQEDLAMYVLAGVRELEPSSCGLDVNLRSFTSFEELPDACAICLDAMSCGNHVSRLPCGHCFHRSCIWGWLASNQTCPLCKRSICSETASIVPDFDGWTAW
eukprot:TRINITY_DN2997_c0_g2_i1.p1 TRINITY_DN2997_c0_g2~~TRINITY_DN2997_c0_g2_i1.p1  ORF type:complete len:665 (+),score=90.52 TRINITY_DN2997_c0_g2_i1:73-2067(+)